MDYAILLLLITLILYLIIRDKIIARKRKKNHVMLKRISTKIDNLSKESIKQNKLFDRLLNILGDEEIK